VMALAEEDIPALHRLKAQGEANGVQGLSIIDAEQIKQINKNLTGVLGLWSAMTGVFDPFAYTVALAEQAVQKGVHYFFNHEVTKIKQSRAATEVSSCRKFSPSGAKDFCTLNNDEEEQQGNSRFYIRTKGTAQNFSARWVINSGGMQSDAICRMIGINDYVIYPCRGEYHVLDKKLSKLAEVPVYPVPNEETGGLGVHLTPSLYGNILIGPSADYISDKENYEDTKDIMDALILAGHQLLPAIEKHHIIRSFAGVRPKLTSEEQGGYADFVIKESEAVEGFIILTGIESPGLTSAIPIAEKVFKFISAKEKLMLCHDKEQAPSNRQASSLKAGLGERQRDPLEFDEKNTNGSQRIICRCEGISEADILSAYDRILSIGAIPSLKGIKNRTRAGTGRCQGGFCTVRIVSLLQEKRGVDPLTLCLSDPHSYLFAGRTRP
jgi:glycerol-3-phosphate dehydrogenase